MAGSKYYLITEAEEKSGVAKETIKRWEKQKLLSMKGAMDRVENPHSKMKDRHFSELGIQLLRWLKYMNGSYKSNDFYLSLLLQYIETGKISQEDLNWPPKDK